MVPEDEDRVESTAYVGGNLSFDDDVASEDRTIVEVGSLVDIGLEETQIAVLLHRGDDNVDTYLLRTGELLPLGNCLMRRSFHIPQFIPPEQMTAVLEYVEPDLVTRTAGDLQLSSEPIPKELMDPVILKMKAFIDQSDAFFREHSATLDANLDKLSDPTETKIMEKTEILDALIPGLTVDQLNEEANHFAVYRAIRRGHLRVNIPSSYRMGKDYEIRPANLVDNLQKAAEWIRHYQVERLAKASTGSLSQVSQGAATDNPVAAFIDKCREAIARFRCRQATRPMAQLDVQPETVPLVQNFSVEEQIFIQFLDLYASQRLVNNGPLQALAAYLIQATDLYETVMARFALNTAAQFLQEIGIRDPNIDNEFYQDSIQIWSHKPYPQEWDHFPGEKGDILGIMKHYGLRDSMAELRKDWGENLFYTLDTSATKTYDDAFSVEEVPSMPGHTLVRFQYADVGALLPDDHILAENARRQLRAFYHPYGKFDMFPSFLQSGLFSLDIHRNRGSKMALCVSVLVGSDGEILDTDLIVGRVREIIHCVLKLNQDTLSVRRDNSLALQLYPPIDEYVGKHVGEVSLGDLPGPAAENLIRAQQLQRILLAKRRARGAFLTDVASIGTVHTDLSVLKAMPRNVFPNSQLPPIGQIKGKEYKPLPRLGYRHSRAWDERGVQQRKENVEIMMELSLLAREAVGVWCNARQLPAVYPIRDWRPQNSKQYKDSVLKLCEIAQDEIGRLPLELSTIYNQLLSPGSDTKPTYDHWNKLVASCKISSPVREYSDIVNQWQIEGAMRWEAKQGLRDSEGLIGSIIRDLNLGKPVVQAAGLPVRTLARHVPDTELPFSRDRLEKYVMRQLAQGYKPSILLEREIDKSLQVAIIKQVLEEQRRLDCQAEPPSVITHSGSTTAPITGHPHHLSVDKASSRDRRIVKPETLPRTFEFLVVAVDNFITNRDFRPRYKKYAYRVSGVARGLETARSFVPVDTEAELYTFRPGDWWHVELQEADTENDYLIFRLAGGMDGLNVDPATGKAKALIKNSELHTKLIRADNDPEQAQRLADWNLVFDHEKSRRPKW